MLNPKIADHHLMRKACIYIRQSTMAQVRFNQESTERQYNLADQAKSLGWMPEQIRILDGDLAQSGELHFLVGIENDLVAVKYQTDWQWKTQLTFLGSIELGAVEARANDVQFCLRERAFHAEDKAVVEVGRIVATISVEHQCLGDGAQFQ